VRPPIIVAELSANMATGSLNRALATVDAARTAGADAIKLQTWSPGTMCLDPDYRIKDGAWQGQRLVDLYQLAATPWEWHKAIFERAKRAGLEVWSTPFDAGAVDFLSTLDCSRYKIASFEILDLELIAHAARQRRPMIISTGMAKIREIDDAVVAARTADNPLTLLQCTSAYPAPVREANLLNMRYMEARWNVRAGLSDHTMGSAVACAATALGAVMIEKHFTLDRQFGGPDAHFSMEPREFQHMVTQVREVAASLGRPRFGPTASESLELRRGVYWASDLPAGHDVTPGDFVTARPSTEMAPVQARMNVGQCLAVAVTRHSAVKHDDFEMDES